MITGTMPKSRAEIPKQERLVQIGQAVPDSERIAPSLSAVSGDPLVGSPPGAGRRSAVLIGLNATVASLRGSLDLDPLTLRRAALASVYVRWSIWLAILVAMAYRPGLWFPDDWPLLILHAPLIVGNGLAHRRLRSAGGLSAAWLVALSGLDLALITTGVIIGAEFDRYFYVGYYPALALFAVIFTSLWLNLIWTSLAAAAYAVVSLLGDARLDLDSGEESALFARIVVMFAIVGCVSLAVRYERRTRQAAIERERVLERERIESSQTIHDTAAQTTLLIGFSIQRAISLADSMTDSMADSMAEQPNKQLREALGAAHSLSRRAIWELRRPIDSGGLFEGRRLSRVLRSHVETFRQISALDVRWSENGVEPSLKTATSSRLFAVAHNALTNVLQHADARSVDVSLDFGPASVRLTVSDDGVGLPADYARRGKGFNGMRRDAERAGGRLIVQSDSGQGGTTVICEAPCAYDPASE